MGSKTTMWQPHKDHAAAPQRPCAAQGLIPSAKSSLLVMRDEQRHTEVPSVDQKENRFHGLNYKCRKFDDPLPKSMISCNSDAADFVDKYVAFESSDKGNSIEESKRVNTTTAWPVGDGTKSGNGNLLGKLEQCEAGCRNCNENAMVSFGENAMVSFGWFLFGRSGLQFTPDGQFLVLQSSIRIPFCRMQNIDCSCSMCKLDQCEDNSLKIVSINFGYVSLMTKLMPYGTVSCILICEPNYIVAAEDSRNLHIWKMVTGWSGISEEYVIPSLGNAGPSILELRKMSKSRSLIIGHDGAGSFCLWDIFKQTLVATFVAPGNVVFQILPVGFCRLQEDIIHAPIDDLEKRLREITVSDMSRENDRESFLMPPRDDIAVWILVSSASVAGYQHDLRAKEHNARWRLALLAKKRIFMGNILDARATAVDASGNYGFAGTYGGLLYTWELSSGRKLAGTQCSNRGPVSCIVVDAKSGVVAVTDGGCQLLLYTQKTMLTDAGSRWAHV
ncbi:uncharacterized protein LOC133903829 [Phragmites australis]|uniref:uncharacterized protein LOC133903829 n=1 Tax=Phragmites australis TaxID=29695 RepID=UPI002D776F01|nr:uncharacterized protein LOC133903829 [Phragmites australis]